MRMERLRVLSSMGGLGPSCELVRLILSTLESSTNQRMEFIILDEANRLISALLPNKSCSGRLSFSTSLLVELVTALIKVKSTAAYSSLPAK